MSQPDFNAVTSSVSVTPAGQSRMTEDSVARGRAAPPISSSRAGEAVRRGAVDAGAMTHVRWLALLVAPMVPAGCGGGDDLPAMSQKDATTKVENYAGITLAASGIA